MKNLLLTVLAFFAIGGCTQITPYRTELTKLNHDSCVADQDKLPPSKCPKDAYFFVKDPQPPYGIPIGIIEFDDQGVLQNRPFKDAIMTRIRKQTQEHGTLTVVFAHGWLNNASPDNKNLAKFQVMLNRIARGDQAVCKGRESCEGRKVVGVYLAWRGMSATIEPFKTMSFWNRKSRAERVGQDGATEVLADLAKIRAGGSTNPKKKSRLILIGHSFGGALIYSATQQLLMEDATDQNPPSLIKDATDQAPPQKDPEDPLCQKKPEAGKTTCKHRSVNRTIANLVILVNPAFEAARFTSLHDRAKEMSFPETQSPILAIFTSKTDNATKLAFPLGRRLSSLFTTYNSDRFPKQSDLDRTAVGHYADYQTHELKLRKNVPLTSPVVSDKDADKVELASLIKAMCSWEKYRTGEPSLDSEGKASPPEWALGRVVLKKKGPVSKKYQHMNPYYNVVVDDEIISGHSGIWDPEFFMNFIYEFVRVQDVYPPPYVNNIIEQDHRRIKRLTRPMLGFKNFDAAQRILAGIEVMAMIQKGQMNTRAGHEESFAQMFNALAA